MDLGRLNPLCSDGWRLDMRIPAYQPYCHTLIQSSSDDAMAVFYREGLLSSNPHSTMLLISNDPRLWHMHDLSQEEDKLSHANLGRNEFSVEAS